MMSDGVTWLPAEPGMATLALKQDGQVVMGAWGREVTPAMDWVAWRQNNPPLIENGVVNPDVHAITNLKEWGVTIGNKAVTWRSGLGLTRDGRWLIYAAGNSLSTETLMAALQAAGAYNAMQTDINNPFDRFETYTAVAQQEQVNNQRVALPLTAQKLIDQMKGGSDQFLVPYDRDFFYLTSQATPAKRAPAPSLVALWQSVDNSNKLISLKK
jgi:Phosphodiester glycosidase